MYASQLAIMRAVGRHHSRAGLASPASISPPDSPAGMRALGATTSSANEATLLLLPQGPLSAADSGELDRGEPPHIPWWQREHSVTLPQCMQAALNRKLYGMSLVLLNREPREEAPHPNVAALLHGGHLHAHSLSAVCGSKPDGAQPDSHC